MSVCVHDVHCPGFGPEHDWATVSLEVLQSARRAAKTQLRKGHPAQRAEGKAMLARVQAALDHGLALKRAEEANVRV